jgi:hypothetical protein
VTAINHARHHDRELQWRRQHIALTDGADKGFTALPSSTNDGFLPGSRWNQAGLFTVEVDAQTLTHAKTPRRFGNFIDAEFEGDLIKPNVARLAHRFDHCHGSVTGSLPAVKPLIAKFDMPWTIRFVLGWDAGFQRREHNRDFKGRSGCVLTRYRFVGQGRQGIVDQTPPFWTAQTFVEGVGIETWRRHHRQNIAIAHIKHHGGGAFFTRQTFRDIRLQARIDGQIDPLSRLTFTAAQFANDAADRVHLHLT